MRKGSIRIIGLGERPPRPSQMVTNDQVLVRLIALGVDTKGKTGVDTENLTGIKTRWWSKMSGYQLAKVAVSRACKDAIRQTAAREPNNRFHPQDIRLIMATSSNHDHAYPACSCKLQHFLGIAPGVCDVRDTLLACSGWVDELHLAKALMHENDYRYSLIVAPEPLGSRANAPTSLNNCLFGDGCGAAVLENDPYGDPHYGIIATHTGSDGQFADYTKSVGVGGAYEHRRVKYPNSSMEGHEKQIHKYAIRDVARFVNNFLDDNGVEGEMPYLLPHNGNLSMVLGMAKNIGLREDRVLHSIGERGNTSSASIPITLTRYAAQNFFKIGDLLLMVAFGGGMAMSFCLYRWG